MSSSNIYNILNKLNALQPKQEPEATAAKPIYESVESQGSIMSGVSSIEKKLSEAYVAEKAKNPYAVGMAQAMKSTGDKPPLKKSTITKAHDIAKKVDENGQPLDTNPKNADWDADALAKQKARLAREKQKIGMQRKISGQDTGLPPAMDEGIEFPDHKQRGMTNDQVQQMFLDYATQIAKQYRLIDKNPVQQIAALAQQVAMSSGTREEAAHNFKRLFKRYFDLNMFEGEVTKTGTGVRHRGTYGTSYQGDADDEEAAAKAADKGPKKRGRPAKGMAKPKAPAGEKKGRGRPAKAAAPTYSGAKDLQGFFGSTAPKKSKVKGTVHKMDESRMIDEAGQHLEHILNRFKHEVKQFEQTGELDDVSGLYDALYDYYCDSGEMPYGVAKARTGDPVAWISNRLEDELGLSEEAAPAASSFKKGDKVIANGAPAIVYNIDAANNIAYVQYEADIAKGSPQTTAAVLNQLKPATTAPAAASSFKKGDKVIANGEPATVYNIDAANNIAYVQYEADIAKGSPQTTAAVLNQLKPAAPAAPAAPAPTMETELNELARLAGLNVSEDEQLDEGECDKCNCAPCECNEGNAFGAAVAKAKADGIQPGEKVQVGGKSYAVKEAEEMINFMRNAGLDTGRAEAALEEAKKYGDTDVEEAPEYANSPDEEIENVEAITRQGNDLNREKKQFAGKPKAGDNPMASEGIDPLEAMGRRLMAAYESIKLVDEGIVDKVKGMFGKKEPSGNLFDQPAVKKDIKQYLKKSAKQPQGPGNVKNIFDDPKYNQK